MNRLLDDPSNFYSYSRLYASSVAAILAWGFRATTLDSFWYKDVSAMIEKVNQAFTSHICMSNSACSGSRRSSPVRHLPST